MTTTERPGLPGYEAAEALFAACEGQIPDVEYARELTYIDSDETGVNWALNGLLEDHGTVPEDVVEMLRAEYGGDYQFGRRLEQLLGMIGSSSLA